MEYEITRDGVAYGVSSGGDAYIVGDPPSYTRTAFVNTSTGVDGAQELNDPAHPFLTADAAAAALAAAYTGQTTTIEFQTNYATTLTFSSDLLSLYDDGLTLKGYGSVRTLGILDFQSVDGTGKTLTLEDVTTGQIVRDSLTSQTTAYNAGTIHGIGTVTVDSITMVGGTGTNSTPGAAGSNDDQSANIPAQAADDTTGTTGASANASGSAPSSDGTDGGGGWSLVLTGAGTCGAISLYGGAGGASAAGGAGATATPSIGGQGGNASSGSEQNGAAGGTGGSSTANGGDASAPGNGGNGGSLNHGSWTLSGGYTISGGAVGSSASGGAPGTAVLGVGGQGGAGDGAGEQGAQGGDGTQTANSGANSPSGSAGSAGSYS